MRILFAELGVPFDFVRTTSVLSTSSASYGDNPLLRVPSLLDDGATLIESQWVQ